MMNSPRIPVSPVAATRSLTALPASSPPAWRRGLAAVVLMVCGALAAPCSGQPAPKLAPPPVAPNWSPQPMVYGYFDHTAAWYRDRAKQGFSPDQTLPRAWKSSGMPVLVVLYSDVRRARPAAGGGSEGLSERIAAAANDIGGYLDDAAANGQVRVLLQVPPAILEQWASDPRGMAAQLTAFVRKWRDKPALEGFYLFDEPELNDIPAATLKEAAQVIAKEAPEGRNTRAISVAYGAVTQPKPVFIEYARASPPAFDALFINRYPVYRAYARSGEGDAEFVTRKLGFDAEKGRRERLRDNEFKNISDYYDTLAAAARVREIGDRAVYASIQAYGSRDDCEGEDCVLGKGKNARRSPTWNELLYMVASAWAARLDGAVLYSRYFALYDTPLTQRLASLDALVPQVFRNLPVDGPGVALAGGSESAGGTHVRYVPDPSGRKVYFLVLLKQRPGRSSVDVAIDPRLRVNRIVERRFDPQGRPQDAEQRDFTKDAQGNARALRVGMQGVGVRLFELHHD
jgi:hypothetical protein